MTESTRVCLQVQSAFIESQAAPDKERYIFAYTITIRNLRRDTIKLLSRYWLITDGNGREISIEGEGVVGEQPLIMPSNEFQYTSGIILDTPIGTMQGYYKMINQSGNNFVVDIPIFRLAIQHHIH